MERIYGLDFVDAETTPSGFETATLNAEKRSCAQGRREEKDLSAVPAETTPSGFEIATLNAGTRLCSQVTREEGDLLVRFFGLSGGGRHSSSVFLKGTRASTSFFEQLVSEESADATFTTDVAERLDLSRRVPRRCERHHRTGTLLLTEAEVRFLGLPARSTPLGQ